MSATRRLRRLAVLALVLAGMATHPALAAPKNGGGSGPVPISECQDIIAPGSYVLVMNLPGASGLLPDGDCLLITADSVTVDMAGFTMSGDGTGDGITSDDATATYKDDITVHNGSVTGFRNGVNLGFSHGASIERIRAVGNLQTGIWCGFCNVTGSLAYDNGGIGIRASQSSSVADNRVLRNLGAGIHAEYGSLVTGNVTRENFRGIYLVRSAANGNIVMANTLDGMVAHCPSNIADNTLEDNGSGGSSVDLFLLGTGCNLDNNLALTTSP